MPLLRAFPYNAGVVTVHRSLFRSFLSRFLHSALLVVGVAALACVWLSPAQAEEPIDVGVLSYRSLEETQLAWAPTAAWLESQVPGRRFRVVPLFFKELTEAVTEGRVSFVLTNPEHFVLLHAESGLTAIATLMPVAEGHPVNHFGGVIFTCADRADIRDLRDIRGKRVSAVSRQSMGGYLAQRWTLFRAGLDPHRDMQLHFTGMPHDKVIAEVLVGAADVGFVRTGILERSIAEGRIAAAQIKVLNPQANTGFPQMLSTDLYPEWPFASLPGLDPALEKGVALALLNLQPDAEAAVKGGYFGFSPPANYGDVDALMTRLDLHPYRKEFGWRDVLERYALWFVTALSLIVVAVLTAAHQLRKSNRALNAAFDRTHELARQRTMLLASLGEGVYGIDRAGHCTFINPAALEMLGFEAEEVLGKDQHALFHHHRPDGAAYPHTECPIFVSLQDGVRREAAETFIRKNGEAFPVRMTATPILEADHTVGAVVVFQDVTEETRRLRRMQLLETGLKAAANGIVITDQDGTIEWVNPAVARLTGYSADEALGQNPRILKSGCHEDRYYAELWQTISAGLVWRGDLVNKRKDGSLYHEEMTITPVTDEHGVIHHFIAVKQDISERKRLEEELRFLATSDPLTGIANRRHFLHYVEDELRRVKRYGSLVALLMLDLDHFKRVNDTWGHAVGDEVLRHFTTLAGGHLRDTDVLGRLGGEEFAVLLRETTLDNASRFAERLRGYLGTEKIAGPRGEISYTVSIGITLLDPRDDAPDAALARADEALYRAKEKGRNRVESLLAADSA